ncbi:hypothetical protein CARUB_v10006687mg [Capsella rubella]|uniref:Uncharacterized protein n=1 Tax=Capsella rubella TaxID=81985 RepID=R0H3U4_9BRAS|nr:hypothetical protein CARUB_v10006687mg [Capsella rubella]
MEELRESSTLVQLENYEIQESLLIGLRAISTVDGDVAIIPISHEEEDGYPSHRDISTVDLLLGGVCQRPWLALSKPRRRRDPPPRVSRRYSQLVSRPIYLRHRFLPQPRKQSSSRRQRESYN